MASNLERFRKDLDALVAKAFDLQLAMIFMLYGSKKAPSLLESKFDEAAIKKAVAGAVTFKNDYQAWYSEALSLLRQVLPDRLEEFKALYEKPKNRKVIDILTYTISDALIGLVTKSGGEVKVDDKAALPKFQTQLAILLAAKKRFQSSLFEIKQLVQADLFDSEISAARELVRNKFLRAAGAIAGVVLEKHLRQVCDDHSVKIVKKNPGISDLNEALKSASIIDIPQWRHITLMGDYRNLCDHNKLKEPTLEQVTDLIDGADKVLKTVF